MARYSLGVISSGSARRFQFLHAAIVAGRLPDVGIEVVICNKPNTAISAMAKELGVPCYIIHKQNNQEIDAAALKILHRYKVQAVLLTGYSRKVTRILLDSFPDRILNIHPGPIPRFGGKGMRGIAVQEAVLAVKASHTGPAVHIVDEEYDHGTVLGYSPVVVGSDDTAATLHERCFEAGGPLLIDVLNRFFMQTNTKPK